MEKDIAEYSAQRWYARFPRALPMGAFLLATGLTALCIFAIERAELQSANEGAEQAASSVSSALERRVAAHSSYLIAGAALIAEQQELTSLQFRRFTARFVRDPSFASAEGIGWAQLVPPAGEAAFIARMRELHFSEYRIFPARRTDAALRIPVTLLEPETPRNRVAMGYDLYSEPTRRAAMDAAARIGLPTASGKVVLIQDRGVGNRAGFMVFMPVTRQEGANSRLAGYIYSAFTAHNVLAASLDPAERRTFGFRLYDGEQRDGRVLAESGVRSMAGPWRSHGLVLAGRPMTLAVQGARTARLSNFSLVTMLFGIVAAGMILVVIRLITQQAMEDRAALAWFEQQASIRNSLTRELNHRVKNTLANVLSIISLTKRRAGSLDEFAEALTGRISALSATHDLLTQSEWGTTPIRAVVDAELAPYIGAAEGTVATRGPDIEIAPNDALSLGLALHELATNAAKFGALSVPGGTVDVGWELVTEGLARLAWSEHGGPPVAARTHRGFGTELIEKIVAHELGTTVDLQFDAAGIRCTLLVPVRLPIDFQIRADKPAVSSAGGWTRKTKPG